MAVQDTTENYSQFAEFASNTAVFYHPKTKQNSSAIQ